jgi:hypothetical protein
MEPLKAKELPRFNMPFECGIDFGIKLSNPQKYQNKKFLILEKEQYRYQKVISDISGNDIKAHKNNPEQIIKVVRDWFKPIDNNSRSMRNPIEFTVPIITCGRCTVISASPCHQGKHSSVAVFVPKR